MEWKNSFVTLCILYQWIYTFIGKQAIAQVEAKNSCNFKSNSNNRDCQLTRGLLWIKLESNVSNLVVELFFLGNFKWMESYRLIFVLFLLFLLSMVIFSIEIRIYIIFMTHLIETANQTTKKQKELQAHKKRL